MTMKNTREDDYFYDSDDELPSLDTLLARLPGRIQQQLSPSKPTSYPSLKNTTLIELDDGNSSAEDHTTDKADSFLDLSDAAPEQVIPPLVKGEERRKRWQSSPKPKPQESDDRSRKATKNRTNIPSTIESQASRKQPRGPSKTGDDAFRNSSSDANDSALRLPQSQTLTTERSRNSRQEELLTQHPRNVSPSRSQITKSSHQPRFPEHEEGKDILRPLSRLRLILQDEPGADTPSRPTMPPKKSKQEKLVSSHGDIHAKEASKELGMDAGQHQVSDDEWDEPDIDCKPKSTRSTVPKPVSKKQTKKSFDARKSQLAIDFLQQLDAQITHGKIAELTQSTGGVKIVWSNTLKTTAGRANWKRETVVPKHTGDSANVDVKQYRHHSSIELSEKVIDDELRLLNVIAHEFCHLANFMINGIRDNPHGKEFKVWAAKCSQMYGSQGINVTTKHTYEIDFKYVWTCTACGCEYKRHSKSIDPKRHRCGACKALLEQTKPTPRQTPTSQLSEYQLFVKEQMKVVKSEHPNSPQKEIMRIIAERWAKVKT
ncbi:hypothetical protein TrVGV298_003770 [Trichoderma virens]|nr:hypothetical protein TrVGV298_003770 [Trichoderma virens]